MAKGKDIKEIPAIPAECVAVILMGSGNIGISNAQFEMMSALDGTRTTSSFEHQFRAIITEAKKLKERVDNGDTFQPVLPAKERAAGSQSAFTPQPAPKKAKAAAKPRGKKGKAVPEPLVSPNDVGEEDENEEEEEENAED